MRLRIEALEVRNHATTQQYTHIIHCLQSMQTSRSHRITQYETIVRRIEEK